MEYRPEITIIFNYPFRALLMFTEFKSDKKSFNSNLNDSNFGSVKPSYTVQIGVFGIQEGKLKSGKNVHCFFK